MNDLNKIVSNKLNEQREQIAAKITQRHYELHPELIERYGAIGRKRCTEDANFHLAYLSEAIESESAKLFDDYIAWAKVMLAGRGIPAEDLANNLSIIRDLLVEELPLELQNLPVTYINGTLTQLLVQPDKLPSYLGSDKPLSELAEKFIYALLRGERQVASKLILAAVEAGISIKKIYLNVFQRSQYEIGRLWQMNQISVAEEHYCTAATQSIMSQLYPYVFAGERNGLTMVSTCVAGDLHEIGVRMVSDFFEMGGWDTFYLGANTPTLSILKILGDRQADLLAISATISFHVRSVADLIKMVRSHSEFEHVKIMVGGYPFNIDKSLWQKIDADGCAHNADDAIEIGNRLMQS